MFTSQNARRFGTLAVLGLSVWASRASAQYQATILNPPGFTETFAMAAGSGQQAGFGSGAATSGNSHALVWSGTAGSYVDLNPTATFGDPPTPYSGSFAYGAGGGQQVGLSIEGLRDVATLWRGTPESAVILATPEMFNSVANDTDGVNQVGSAQVIDPVIGLSTFAHAWSGSAASATFIHPGGFLDSNAFKVRAGRAVGTATDDVGFYAGILWTQLSSSGAVVLRTADYLETSASDVLGTTVVGHGYPDGGAWHALIWTDNGANISDVHPNGYFTSFLYAMNDTQQVGLASTPRDVDGNNNEHAMVWSGTAASAIDLHPFLTQVAPEFTDSAATSIDADGSIYGYARVGGSGYAAVRWTPVAVTSGVCCIGVTCATVSSQAACQTSASASGLAFSFVPSASCNAPANSTTPCCRADFNKVGGVTVQDIFDFLAAYFSSSPAADFTGNGTGAPTVQSIFDFLGAYFGGGC